LTSATAELEKDKQQNYKDQQMELVKYVVKEIFV